MKVGEVLVFQSECSDHHDFMEPGDVHIVLQEADEAIPFRRRDTTLHMNLEMTLVDCLLGKSLVLQGHPGYPNGLTVEIPPGKMTGTTHIVEEKGMPKRGTQGYGTLECHIMVTITDMEKERLEKQSVLIRTLFT
jgi:DnaJ-class molecular chaperone